MRSGPPIRIKAPLSDAVVAGLRAGDRVLLSGVIYTARDAAHERFVKLLREGGALPFDIAGSVIYYAGPTPAKPGHIVGALGPTTSGRMDAYTPELLKAGLKGMIGKGPRSEAVVEAVRLYAGIYFAATGGAAALLSKRVLSCEVVSYEDLGCEAVHRLEVSDFPLIVINDCEGRDYYRDNRAP